MSAGLLSPIAALLLGIAALLKLSLLGPNPLRRTIDKYEGMTEYEREAAISKEIRQNLKQAIIEDIWEFEYTLILFLSIFVIDPLIAILAITRNIGNQPLAYFMLILAIFSAGLWIRNVVLGVKMSNGGHVDEAETGLLSSRLVTIADKLNLSERTWYWIRRIYVMLPEFYIWYLFLIVLISFR